MSDILIRRKHQLGLARAREIAWKWAEDAEEQFEMECTVEEGDDCDVVHFERSGVKGTLQVEPDHFELTARLGLLLGAFKQKIQAEIENNLDTLLAEETARAAQGAAPPKKTAAKKATAKKASGKTPK
jgi:putative polyhydroxyalkanoate system protein